MRDRLIELFKKKTCCLVECDHDCVGCDCLDLREGDVYSFVDYLLANGVIVPPCKVGDKLYAISENRIKECTCYEFLMYGELTISAEFNCDYDCEGCPFSAWGQEYSGEYSCRGEFGEHIFLLGDFGKTVFLTREEAEKALAERSAE